MELLNEECGAEGFECDEVRACFVESVLFAMSSLQSQHLHVQCMLAAASVNYSMCTLVHSLKLERQSLVDADKYWARILKKRSDNRHINVVGFLCVDKMLQSA